MNKGVSYSIYYYKLIIFISAVCNILYIYIYNLYNSDDEFIVMSNHSFFVGLDLYLFIRYNWCYELIFISYLFLIFSYLLLYSHYCLCYYAYTIYPYLILCTSFLFYTTDQTLSIHYLSITFL